MGISGLLPQLKSITKRVHLSKFRNQTIAVDAYCLLHKGAYSCARELVEGEYTDKYITYCMSRIELLQNNGITPYIVFDGGPLPNKADEEKARQRSREEHREKARLLWRRGNKTAAIESYQKAVDITPAIANALVAKLASLNIQFIVAPFEADAQCAYLALNNMVDAVLTEDSDLLAYGCPRVLFKLDWNGDVDEISLADLPNCRDLNFVGWTHNLFQEMCVMAGCDFIKALPGIGIKKAHTHIRRTRDFIRALRALRFDGVQVPQEYEIRFQRALWTFRHQRVYCPVKARLVHLKEPSGGDISIDAAVPAAAVLEEGEEDFLGPIIDDRIVQGIAEGKLDPVTHTAFLQSPSCLPGLHSYSLHDGSRGDGQHAASLSARRHYKKPRQADTTRMHTNNNTADKSILSTKNRIIEEDIDGSDGNNKEEDNDDTHMAIPLHNQHQQPSFRIKRKSSMPLHAIVARHFPNQRTQSNNKAAIQTDENDSFFSSGHAESAATITTTTKEDLHRSNNNNNNNNNNSNNKKTSLRKRLQASLNASLLVSNNNNSSTFNMAVQRRASTTAHSVNEDSNDGKSGFATIWKPQTAIGKDGDGDAIVQEDAVMGQLKSPTMSEGAVVIQNTKTPNWVNKSQQYSGVTPGFYSVEGKRYSTQKTV